MLAASRHRTNFACGVRESKSLVISGWSLADAGRQAIRALSAVGYGIVTALLWLGVFIPVILAVAAAVYGLVWLRRRREGAGERRAT